MHWVSERNVNRLYIKEEDFKKVCGKVNRVQGKNTWIECVDRNLQQFKLVVFNVKEGLLL